MQVYAAVRVGPGGSIFEVALDWAAHGGELAADLVVTPGEEVDFQQVVALGVSYMPIAKARDFGTLRTFLADEAFVETFVTDHPVLKFSFAGVGSLTAECPIGFVYVAFAEHLRESFKGF